VVASIFAGTAGADETGMAIEAEITLDKLQERCHVATGADQGFNGADCAMISSPDFPRAKISSRAGVFLINLSALSSGI
jgi:hypothetical protein